MRLCVLTLTDVDNPETYAAPAETLLSGCLPTRDSRSLLFIPKNESNSKKHVSCASVKSAEVGCVSVRQERKIITLNLPQRRHSRKKHGGPRCDLPSEMISCCRFAVA